MLTTDQKQFWDRNGFLVLPAFFSEPETDAVNRLVSQAWSERPDKLVVDDLVTSRRSYIRDVSAEDAVAHRFKVNDLYLGSTELRGLCLDERVAGVLAQLLGDAPVLCNTLNLEQGSEQDDHIDSLYMTPKTPGNLAATWIALEDSHPDAGPLRYYPGSHRLPLHRFSNGGYNAIEDEMPAWTAHVRRHVEAAGLKREEFLAQRGDLFIWHANLLHGGGAIRSKSRTRKSLVSHYWTLGDCRKQAMEAVPHGSGYWYRRPPQPVGSPSWKGLIGPAIRRLRRSVLPGRAHGA